MRGMIMSYCIYLRKSRADMEAESSGEGETLARHEKALMSLSKKLNIDIQHIYREIVSGESISARPIMQDLLREVEKGLWDGVLVMEIERLARGDTIDQGILAQVFKYSNTKIVTPLKTYNPNNEFDEEYFEFGLFMSRREYKTINRRLQQGRLQSVKEGKYLGSIAPYGYCRIKVLNDKGYTLEVLEYESNVVRMIYELYLHGDIYCERYEPLGPSLIAKRLYSIGVRPRNSYLWSPSSIRDILKNPVYMGKIRWNYRKSKKNFVDGKMIKTRPRSNTKDIVLIDGLHDAIIDKTTWHEVQSKMTSRSSAPTHSKNPIKNPLSGIVRCGICGRSMVRRPHLDNYKDTLMCPNSECKNVSSSLCLVESVIIDALRDFLSNYELSYKYNYSFLNTDIAQRVKEDTLLKLNTELDTLSLQLDRLHDLLEQGIYSTDVFIKRSNYISDKVNDSKKLRSHLLKELSFSHSVVDDNQYTIPRPNKVLNAYEYINDPSVKNLLLKNILLRVDYRKKAGGRWSKDRDKFEIDLYPRLPFKL